MQSFGCNKSYRSMYINMLILYMYNYKFNKNDIELNPGSWP